MIDVSKKTDPTDEELTAQVDALSSKNSKTSLNSDVQSLLDANPYKNYQYNESPWQQFLSGLGFRTAADAYRENMALQAKEYDAGIIEKVYNEQYDSAAQNAARMRAGGLNPDLLGADQGGSSSPLRDDGNPPVASDSDIESVTTFANTIMSAFSGAVGFAKDLGSLNSVILGNEQQSIINDSSWLQLAQDWIVHSTKRDDFRSSLNAPEPLQSVRFNALDSFAREYGRGTRRYNRFMNAVDTVFSGLPTEEKAFKAWLADQSARKEGTFFNTSNDYSDSYPTLRSIGKHLGRLAQQTQNIGVLKGFYQGRNELEYETYRDGQAEGIAATDEANMRSSEASARENRADIALEINRTWNDMTKDLQRLADNGDKFASIFLALINVARLQLLKF